MSKACFIFITGGVVSSLGKGLATATIGALLQAHGFTVQLRKFDPYLNIDSGTMNPYQHGEIFITEDGTEADLDLGHYERFTAINTDKHASITAGKIYQRLLQKERRGDYLGATIQVVPHVTDLIQEAILYDADKSDFILCELGGTVGDIEGQPFLEAIRQIGYRMTRKRVLYIHLTLIPYMTSAHEVKTKPTQHSVKELQSFGIQPDIILCRCKNFISTANQQKIALFCNIKEKAVISATDVSNIYKLPLVYHRAGLDKQIFTHFHLQSRVKVDLDKWSHIIHLSKNLTHTTTIAIVGKYTALADAYKSLIEALEHAGLANKTRIKIVWIEARTITQQNIAVRLANVNAVIIPGGFGVSGIDGKLIAIKYAREENIPFLGICLGMQLAVIEIARSLANIRDANSSEFNPNCLNPVVSLLSEWQQNQATHLRSTAQNKGGTMRLGSYSCIISKPSLAHEVYSSTEISERHRHRYEFNVQYRAQLQRAGIVFSGICAQNNDLVEIIELPQHPWFMGVQFHPELRSRPFAPHLLFVSLIRASLKNA